MAAGWRFTFPWFSYSGLSLVGQSGGAQANREKYSYFYRQEK